MNTDMNTVRLLGAAQVLVIVGFLITEQLLASAIGSGSISDILVHISKRFTLMRIGNVAALGQTLVIIALGVLYYVVYYKEYQIIALVALGCFLLAAMSTVVAKIGTSGSLDMCVAISQGWYVASVAPGSGCRRRSHPRRDAAGDYERDVRRAFHPIRKGLDSDSSPWRQPRTKR